MTLPFFRNHHSVDIFHFRRPVLGCNLSVFFDIDLTVTLGFPSENEIEPLKTEQKQETKIITEYETTEIVHDGLSTKTPTESFTEVQPLDTEKAILESNVKSAHLKKESQNATVTKLGRIYSLMSLLKLGLEF